MGRPRVPNSFNTREKGPHWLQYSFNTRDRGPQWLSRHPGVPARAEERFLPHPQADEHVQWESQLWIHAVQLECAMLVRSGDGVILSMQSFKRRRSTRYSSSLDARHSCESNGVHLLRLTLRFMQGLVDNVLSSFAVTDESSAAVLLESARAVFHFAANWAAGIDFKRPINSNQTQSPSSH